MVNPKIGGLDPRICPGCGIRFVPNTAQRRKCFRCAPPAVGANRATVADLRAARGLAPVADIGPERPPAPPSAPGEHERAVRAELAKLEWLETIEGVGAIGLAISLDDRGLPGAQRTSLLKQLRDVIAEIRALAPREPDAVDGWQEAARRRREANG